MKKSTIIILTQIFIFSLGFAQQKENFLFDNSAQFEGGDLELRKYIVENTKYPKDAKRYCISGKINVSFIVDSLGTVQSVEALNSLGYGCDEEAIRVIKSTNGKWNPGTKDNKPINYSFIVPVNFTASKDCKPYYVEYIEAGNKFFEKEQFRKAIIQYDKLIELKPFDPEILFKRGIAKLSICDTLGACCDWNNIPKILNDRAKDYVIKYCD